ncbi:polysaccharide pyruvyl transferase family protein [Glaciecola petra]|uniref:Polysaccharide pyruvyl transferase family protein n=1 Tax=Glaciecola petra TaxID=3075602 RepID=A0ABU2ZWZ2_9ALTE|nr:polysaccharide pyruvyl transferase family protein [Aestuariibacter sp. P117]MDT0595942.1 polysaccharide pyruvyl transferase family protein [Aestuariibacter sp. P117]
MKNIICVETVTQFENAGDELINLALIDLMRVHGNIVLNDRQSPKWYLDRLMSEGDQYYSDFNGHGGFYFGILKRQFKQLFSAKTEQYYIALPPGHFSQKGKKAAIDISKLFIKLIMLRLVGVRVMRAGFSIGPFDRANQLAQKIGSYAFHLYGLRDTVTLEYSKKIGINKATLFPDMAWALDISKYEKASQNENKIVICFRSNAYGTEHSETYLQPLMQSLSAMLSAPEFAKSKLVFCYQVEFDKAASTYLYNNLKDKYNCTNIEYRLGISEAFTLYSGAKTVISNRLHVLLLAAQASSLPLALVNKKDNVKITSIFNDNQLGDCILDLDLNDKELKDSLEHVLKVKSNILSTFKQKRESNFKAMKALFSKAFN